MTRHDIGWRHLVADSGTSGGRHTVTSQLTVAGYPENCGFKLLHPTTLFRSFIRGHLVNIITRVAVWYPGNN